MANEKTQTPAGCYLVAFLVAGLLYYSCTKVSPSEQTALDNYKRVEQQMMGMSAVDLTTFFPSPYNKKLLGSYGTDGHRGGGVSASRQVWYYGKPYCVTVYLDNGRVYKVSKNVLAE